MNGNPYFCANDGRVYLQAVNTETARREEIARLQAETQDLRHKMMMDELSARLKYGYYVAEELEKKEEEPVKNPKSPFEIRVELWEAVNEEIEQVEEFLENLKMKQPWIARFFNVQCYRKVRTGFTVDTGRRMELPAALQEKMIRTAEEYLEDLKKQKKDMEEGYND